MSSNMIGIYALGSDGWTGQAREMACSRTLGVQSSTSQRPVRKTPNCLFSTQWTKNGATKEANYRTQRCLVFGKTRADFVADCTKDTNYVYFFIIV
jgi:hypothetical protein